MRGDLAFYFKQTDDKLEGMILLHVDDVIIGGSNEFVNNTTNMIKEPSTYQKQAINPSDFVA